MICRHCGKEMMTRDVMVGDWNGTEWVPDGALEVNICVNINCKFHGVWKEEAAFAFSKQEDAKHKGGI